MSFACQLLQYIQSGLALARALLCQRLLPVLTNMLHSALAQCKFLPGTVLHITGNKPAARCRTRESSRWGCSEMHHCTQFTAGRLAL